MNQVSPLLSTNRFFYVPGRVEDTGDNRISELMFLPNQVESYSTVIPKPLCCCISLELWRGFRKSLAVIDYEKDELFQKARDCF